MTPQDLLGRLVALFPDFAACWDDPENIYRDDDGSYTLCGVFSEFTDFFRSRHEALPADRVAALGAFVSECMATRGTDLDNAAATCFVENVAGEPCGRDLAPYLTGDALDYYRVYGENA